MTPDRHTSEDELVRAHLHLANQAVNELARRLPSHVNRDDLCSAAMLGLAQAARSWDPDRGACFERHAATRIRGALLDELRDSDWASRSVRSRARRLQQAGEELTGRLGRARPRPSWPPSWAPTPGPSTGWSTTCTGRPCSTTSPS
jgi:RNA polymerase sigma factor FliA